MARLRVRETVHIRQQSRSLVYNWVIEEESKLAMKRQQLWVNRWWLTILLIAMVSLWVATTAKAQTPTPPPTVTQGPAAQGIILYNTNLRAGPGTVHAAVGKVRAGQTITITATSPDGNWYQVGDGQWLAALVVEHNAGTLTAVVTPTPARRLVATATPPLSATPTVRVTPMLRNLRATAIPTATAIISTTSAVTGTTALRNANLRAGPGTNYAIVGNVRSADRLAVQGQTSDGTWYQLGDGRWIAAFLVAPTVSTLPTVAPAVIAGLPTLAPTVTPTPMPSLPTVKTSIATPVVAENTAAATAIAPNAPTSSGTTTFVVTRRRLWNPWENGGSTDGPSVHCGQGRNLIVNVLDESGNRLNGVAVQAEYGAKEIWVTGAQGKGDGIVEFVLGSGQDVKVIRDANGSPVNSEAATGLSTDPRGIDQESLINAGYCQDDDSCRTFVNNLSCIGHYSWTVTFERRRGG